MSDNQERSNELPEIIDVDFLPILDDEDYKREKASQAQGLDQTLVDTNKLIDSQAQITDRTLSHTDKLLDTEEATKENFNVREYIKEDGYKKGTEYSQANAYTNTEQTSGYTNYKQTEQNYNQQYTQNNNQSNNQNMRQDTSYASYDQARRQEFKKKKKKFGASILSGIGIIMAIFIGLPIALGLGGTAVFVIGMGVFLSILALGVGVLGLGMAGFTAAAGMGPMGVLFLFGSLVALGVGGLGLCIICLMFIGVKNLIVGMNRRRKIRKESEEV